MESYIPAHGTYKGGPDNFYYDQENDQYRCPQGKWLTFRKTKLNARNLKESQYATRRKDCRDCPIAAQCKGSSQEKRIRATYYRKEYERAIKRLKTSKGRYLMNKRKSTVEPVFGTLKEFMGLRKIGTIGISQANKKMLMAAMAYNLKKYLKFTSKSAISRAKAACQFLSQQLALFMFELMPR